MAFVLQVSKQDWLVWMVVFVGCLFVGIDWGLLFGVGLSIVIQLGFIVFPSLHVLGRLPGTATYRSVPCCIGHCVWSWHIPYIIWLGYIVFPSLHVLGCLPGSAIYRSAHAMSVTMPY